MSKFQAGPWNVLIGADAGELNGGVHYNSNGRNPYYAVVAADGSVVVDNCDYYSAALNPKNAHLIAASPCLLEALQLLIMYADDSDGCQYGILSTKLVREIAQEAIAKALA